MVGWKGLGAGFFGAEVRAAQNAEAAMRRSQAGRMAEVYLMLLRVWSCADRF
jgi:hypothetical protein